MARLKEVLLVEDDPVIALVHRVVIERNGLADRLVCKSNGLEALHYLQQTCWTMDELLLEECTDLILLDINMPFMNGFELLQALKEQGAALLIHSRVVMLSSSSHKRDLQQAHDFGVKGYLLKPLSMACLQSLL